MKRVAIVTSRFNESITEPLYQSTCHQLQADDATVQIESYWVPGAVEIPILAQRLAQKHRFDAVICLGAVIRGDTDHYVYVCQQVSAGCQEVSLKYDLPVIFGLLTTENQQQAFDRIASMGTHAAQSALEMIELLQQIS